MTEFLRAGGFPIWIVLVLSLLVLAASGHFALRADAKRLAIIKALTWATVFSIVGGVISNFMAVMWGVPDNDEWAHSPDMPLIVMRGLGEAVTPAVLGFTVLSLAWLFVAVGMRRIQELRD
jgi:hypothetical protein